MKNLLTLLLLIKLVFFSEKINATNYYFSSTDGDDSRTSAQAQNSSTPWKTINKLNSIFSSIQPGDQILFERGDVFYGSINITKSGSSGLPITFDAYGTGINPVISGLSSVTSWTSIGTNLWESTSAVSTLATLNMVVANGSFQPIGRWPKLNTTNSGYLTINSSTATSITSTGLSGLPGFAGGEIIIRKRHWIIDREIVSSQSGTTVTFSNNNTVYLIQNGYGFFFQNHVNACTVQGDWAYNSSTKKITIYGVGTPSGVQVTNVDNLVTIGAFGYLTFNNIEFRGSNSKTISINSGSNITFSNCSFNFAGINCFNVASSSATNNSILNCTANYTNNNFLVANTSSNWTISGNVINNTGTIAGMGQSQDGNYFTTQDIGSGSSITLNTLTNCGYIGLSYIGSNITIQNNYINNFCIVKDDGGAIYTGRTTLFTNRKILNNIIIQGGNNGLVDNGSNGLGSSYGIYVDQGAQNVQVQGNTIASCHGGGIHLNSASNIQITSNTLFDNTRGFDYTTHSEPGIPIANVTQTGNIFFAKTSAQLCGFAQINTGGNAVSTWGSWDNNYYCRPINEPNNLSKSGAYGAGSTGGVFQTATIGISTKDYSLNKWKTISRQDAHSKKSPKTITDIKNLRFEYNATSSNKVISLGAIYIDVTGKNYAGSITLAPYSSAVLIYVSGHHNLPLAHQRNYY